MNLANANALELLAWLGVEQDWCGTLDAADLAARCRRRLWDESRNHDPMRPAESWSGAQGCRVIVAERREGYLREQTGRLLAIAEQAQRDGYRVSWA
jgi:hypothetical protein